MRPVDLELAGLNAEGMSKFESALRKRPLKDILLREMRLQAYADRLRPAAEGFDIAEGVLDGRFRSWYRVQSIVWIVRDVGVDKIERARRAAIRAASRMVDEKEEEIRKEAEEEFKRIQK